MDTVAIYEHQSLSLSILTHECVFYIEHDASLLLFVSSLSAVGGVCSGAAYLLVGLEQHADGAVWSFGAHALIVLSLFLHVGRSALPQVSQGFGPVFPFQTTLLYRGVLL